VPDARTNRAKGVIRGAPSWIFKFCKNKSVLHGAVEKGKSYMNVILNEVKNLSYLCGREMLRYHSA